MSLAVERTVSWQSVCHVFVQAWLGGAKTKIKGEKIEADLPEKVSEWGHEPHAPNSYLPACAFGNADSPPLLVGQSHWLHQAKPGWDLSKSAVQGPVAPLQSLPPFQSPGLVQGHAWSSGWAAISFGAGRDWVMMVAKKQLPTSFQQTWILSNHFHKIMQSKLKSTIIRH